MGYQPGPLYDDYDHWRDRRAFWREEDSCAAEEVEQARAEADRYVQVDVMLPGLPQVGR